MSVPDRGFRKSDLEDHVGRVHKKEKPFPCQATDCNYVGFNKSELQTHVDRVHLRLGEKYRCDASCEFSANAGDGQKRPKIRDQHNEL